MLIVVLMAEGSHEPQDLRVRAASLLSDSDADVHFRPLAIANVLQLAAILHSEECGTLVLPVGSPALQDNALVDLLEYLEVPVLLVT